MRLVARERSLRVVVLLALLACGRSDATGPEPDEQPIPPPGPHFTVLPIPMDAIARISALGTNSKILPIGHTYWTTCDFEYLLPSGRPCLLEHLPIRAPADAIVFGVDAQDDGGITLEGPPGLHWTFAHVTPTAGLQRGDTIRAGDVIARMSFTYSFDFGVTNYAREPHEFARNERYLEFFRYTESPVAQFVEPLRSQLIERVVTLGDPFGRVSFDVPGTAAGGWFLEGTPPGDASFIVEGVPKQLFLGRLQERPETRILIVGERWPGLINRMAVVDEAAPSWDDITAADGPVAVKLWALTPEGLPKLDFPHGTALFEVLAGGRLRIDWFDTHGPVTTFSATARIYER